MVKRSVVTLGLQGMGLASRHQEDRGERDRLQRGLVGPMQREKHTPSTLEAASPHRTPLLLPSHAKHTGSHTITHMGTLVHTHVHTHTDTCTVPHSHPPHAHTCSHAPVHQAPSRFLAFRGSHSAGPPPLTDLAVLCGWQALLWTVWAPCALPT